MAQSYMPMSEELE
jgi:hypothetical protein